MESNSSISSKNECGGEVILITPPKHKKKQVSPAKHWVFTFNNYTTADYKNLEVYFRKNSSKFQCIVFQEEIGEECGTPHIQGAFSYINKSRPFNMGLNKKIFYQKKNPKSTLTQMRDYCCRPSKRAPNGKVFLFNYQEPIILKILEESKLYKWQKFVIEQITKEPNDRDIIWIHGPSGLGKSVFTKYLVHYYNGLVLQGGRRHILSVASRNTRCKLFIFLLSMSDRNKLSYGALEQLKDGVFMSHFGCDDTKPVIMNSPHIIVFANYPPRDEKIAHKKLKCINLKELKECQKIMNEPKQVSDLPFYVED